MLTYHTAEKEEKMSTTLELWASKLVTPEIGIAVSSDEKVSLGLATFRAFKKLTLLLENADQKQLVDHYNELYADFRKDYSIEYAYIQPPMSETFGPIQLFHAFRKAYKAHEEPCMPLWRQYELADYKLPQAGVVRSMVTGGEDNDCSEIGLYLTSLVVEKQIEKGRKKIAKFNKANAGLKATVLDPVGYVVLDAIRLELGLSPLDKLTVARFIDISEKLVNGVAYVPNARWSYGELDFDGSGVGNGWVYSGVRFSVEKIASA